MNHRKTVFIVNPCSGNGLTGKEWPRIRRLAHELLGDFEAFLTAGPGDATRLTREILQRGVERIICVGGDGTLNETINGFMDASGPIRPEALLGFLPNGTGCDFYRTVGKNKGLEDSLEMIRRNPIRTIDLGRVCCRDQQGREVVRYFHNVVSFGLGGEVDDRVNHTTKVFGPFLSFIWATLVSILIYEKKQVRVRVDDRFEKELSVLNVAVANGQYHGGGMRVAPDARVDDGLFHITVIGKMSLPKILWHLPKLYNGKIMKVPGVLGLTGTTVTAASEQTVLIDLDGEQIGRLPVIIEIVPAAIRMILP